MKNLLISTHCDLDAIGIIILTEYVRKLKGFEKDYEHVDIWFNDYLDYEKGLYPYDDLRLYDEVWYFDFTPNKECREVLAEEDIKCIIGDHHEGVKKEIEEWNYENKRYIFNNDDSGAKIYYNFLIEKNLIKSKPVLEEFVERVSTYDLYTKTSPLWEEAQNLNRLLYKSVTWSKSGLEAYSYFINSMVNKCLSQEHLTYTRLEETKIRETVERENSLFNDCLTGKIPIKTRKDRKGRYFCILKLGAKISIIASRLLDHFPKLDYVLVVNTYGGSAKLSVRSNKLNLLTEFKNMGGHAPAAGYNGTEMSNEDYCNNLWSGKIWCLESKE